MPIFVARPDEIWIVHFRSKGSLFSHAFDPNRTNAPDRIIVQSLDEDKISIEPQFEGYGPYASIVSRKAGFRVVENREVIAGRDENQRPAQHRVTRYEWEQLANGFWAVREVVETWTFPEVSDIVFGRHSVKLLEYDPDPKIPADRFNVEGLGLPDGTSVTEIRGSPPNIQQRNYTIGESGEIPQELLDSLADELNKSGFGRDPMDD